MRKEKEEPNDTAERVEGNAGTDRKKAGARVLVLDHESSSGSLLRAILAENGYLCVLTSTPEEALEAVEKERFELAVLELNLPLPGKSGGEVAWEIRKKDLDIPILAMSTYLGRWEPDDLADLAHLGINHVLTKPFTPDEFNKAVAKVLGVHQPPDQTQSLL